MRSGANSLNYCAERTANLHPFGRSPMVQCFAAQTIGGVAYTAVGGCSMYFFMKSQVKALLQKPKPQFSLPSRKLLYPY